MTEIIRLKRYSDSSWGFRLTGGYDFGTPLNVVKVTGGSIAALNGVKVGDIIVEINGQSAKYFVQADAQKCMGLSGNQLTLRVLRGGLISQVKDTTGERSPLQFGRERKNLVDEYYEEDGNENQLKEQLETVEHTFSFNSNDEMKETSDVYDDNDSKPAAEQELDATLKVSDTEIAEILTGNEEVLEEGILGINFKKYMPQVDFIRQSEVFKLLQDENCTVEVSEELQLKSEPTKRFSSFLQKPKPALSTSHGSLWHYPKPPRFLPRVVEQPKENSRPVNQKGHSVLWLFLGESCEHVVDERWGNQEEERNNFKS